jgi:transcriptional regulator with XRE-family HTH domain
MALWPSMAPSKRTQEEIDAIKRIGARVRARRQAKGWKVQDLATKSGVSFEHIHAIERGKHKPRDYTLRRLARALGVSVKSLEEDPPTNGGKKSGRKNGNGNGGRK